PTSRRRRIRRGCGWATSCRSATSSTRSSRASGADRRTPSRRWTRRSSAATSSSSGSKRPTVTEHRHGRPRRSSVAVPAALSRRERPDEDRMEKRVVFKSPWLPYALVAPQLIITLVFFFWPASQAMYWSMLIQDAFAARTQFVWFDNFRDLFNDPRYLASFQITAVFSVLVTFIGLAVALLLAVFADRVVRGARVYKTLLIWPYAVAAAVAAVLWLFLLNPTLGVVTHLLRALGYDWNYLLNARQALILIVITAVWKQISYNFLFFLAGLQSVPKSLIEAAAIDGAGPARRFWTIIFPMLSPTTFFLLVVNIVYAFFDTFAIVDAATGGGPVQATAILVFKVYQDGVQALDLGGSAAQSVVLMAIVIALTVIQFRFVERKVQY